MEAEEALRTIKDPLLRRDIISLGYVHGLTSSGNRVRFTLRLPSPASPHGEELAGKCREALLTLDGIDTVEIETAWEVPRLPALEAPTTPAALAQVKQIIAVASGKGGVGKSTIAVNLAFACAQAGARVGILDIDVYGPSVPGMFGLREHRLIGGQQGVLEPVKAHGLEIMSMGFLTTKETPVVWRGPIASQLVQQFLGMVAWGELDYLFVDLPPGTGDIQLTLTQSVPLSGVLIVTTPQVVAHTIAEKGLRMFQQVKVPILGIIENMAYYHCPECDHHDPIFREGGGEAVAKAMDLPLLARIPLNSSIATAMDAGEPLAEGEIGDAFRALAGEAMARASATALGEALNPAAPQELAIAAGGAVQVKWRDGVEQAIPAHTLRSECPCAGCVDEFSGEKLLLPEQIPTDIVVASTASIGRYAVRFDFSDGHNSGIYEFARLRAIGDNASDAAAFEV
ncbi:MAG: P-loop NTPase [Candidatus Poseidoniia archaeon]|nr:P-loop NTPase [Candidatus Poseidoniia archaeon]HJO27866.1 P-loop NTPase [Candidatus Poseidoniia archaeon]|tara:strand:+ start:149 stop:1513 length:1365 start_codon:yes stop_codon:yes gene_type:complete